MTLVEELCERALLGLDVRSLCAAISVSSSWSHAASKANVWRVALLEPQVPTDMPGTYSSVFTVYGVTTFEAAAGVVPLGRHAASTAAGSQDDVIRIAADEALAAWDPASALRLLAAASPNSCLRNLAHFIRRSHTGVEAELLKVRMQPADPGCVAALGLHCALEVLNFFPSPR
eukprot:gnl/TRDRNA2_/TRDRNA2_82303_c0_seq1.p1 gnl/TRDRNA2_/TRDRNA2_82303_c0~~gnl/TRDRNA2_/TRDRNA2_82303_c0_seq1.p1  ORF type:complete len:174 (-),score=28.96 gnl/TRDRNA2_/TRDRNA2_82303_c0_seq1:19-540(-)